jgi:hypothetical protein
MRTLILAVLVALAPVPALAYCPSVPDTVETGFVGNQTARTLCLQQQLGVDLARSNAATATNATLDALARAQLQQHLALEQLQAQLLQQRLDALRK